MWSVLAVLPDPHPFIYLFIYLLILFIYYYYFFQKMCPKVPITVTANRAEEECTKGLNSYKSPSLHQPREMSQVLILLPYAAFPRE